MLKNTKKLSEVSVPAESMMLMNRDTIVAGGSGEGATVNGVQAGEGGRCIAGGAGDPGSQPGGALQSVVIFLSVYCGIS